MQRGLLADFIIAITRIYMRRPGGGGPKKKVLRQEHIDRQVPGGGGSKKKRGHRPQEEAGAQAPRRRSWAQKMLACSARGARSKTIPTSGGAYS